MYLWLTTHIASRAKLVVVISVYLWLTMRIASRAKFVVDISVCLGISWIVLITVLEGRVGSLVYLMHVGELLSLFYNGACLDLIVPGRSQNVIFVFWNE